MTSRNELLKLIAGLVADRLAGDYTFQVGANSRGYFIRTGDMIYQIDATKIEQISNAENPEKAADDFMGTLDLIEPRGMAK